MNKHLGSSISPEQKLAILQNQMVTPLAIIRGHAAMMKKYYEFTSGKPDEIMDWIDAITKAANYLEELRNDLL